MQPVWVPDQRGHHTGVFLQGRPCCALRLLARLKPSQVSSHGDRAEAEGFVETASRSVELISACSEFHEPKVVSSDVVQCVAQKCGSDALVPVRRHYGQEIDLGAVCLLSWLPGDVTEEN